jgi:hypothetical protein
MSEHATSGSDTGAAFLGLIGGAIFVGAVLLTIVLLTNRHFENEKAEAGAKGAAKTSMIVAPASAVLG